MKLRRVSVFTGVTVAIILFVGYLVRDPSKVDENLAIAFLNGSLVEENGFTVELDLGVKGERTLIGIEAQRFVGELKKIPRGIRSSVAGHSRNRVGKITVRQELTHATFDIISFGSGSQCWMNMRASDLQIFVSGDLITLVDSYIE